MVHWHLLVVSVLAGAAATPRPVAAVAQSGLRGPAAHARLSVGCGSFAAPRGPRDAPPAGCPMCGSSGVLHVKVLSRHGGRYPGFREGLRVSGPLRRASLRLVAASRRPTRVAATSAWLRESATTGGLERRTWCATHGSRYWAPASMVSSEGAIHRDRRRAPPHAANQLLIRKLLSQSACSGPALMPGSAATRAAAKKRRAHTRARESGGVRV